jgi:hypothetical protein
VLGAICYFIFPDNKFIFYFLLIDWIAISFLVFKKIYQKILFFIPLLFLFILYSTLKLPSVQTWLVKEVANKLSDELQTTVSVKGVDIGFFNKVMIEGVMIKDQQKDTLLYAGVIKGNVNDWFFIKDKITVENVGMDDVVIKLHRSDSVWNYQFIADYFASPKKKNSTTKQDVALDLKELHFNNIKFSKIDEWVGEDMIANLGKMDVVTDLVDTKNKKIHIKEIHLEKPFFAQNDYDGKKPENNTPKQPKIKIPTDFKWNNDGWEIKLDRLDLKDGAYKNDKQTDAAPIPNRFDGEHLFFNEINATFKNLTFIRDTVQANLVLTTKERGGLDVKKLQSIVKFTPDIMEFDSLDLVTAKSKLGDYYAMKYEDFNADFARFLHNVKLEGRFKNSIVNSDDIAIFAPALSSWKRILKLEGNVNGALDNFTAKNMKLTTGSTYLEGNFTMRGLPDINSTFMELESKSLRTNYTEIVSFVPSIKKIDKPAISKLGAVTFVGNFVGFLNDFVAYGKFNTALGNITADVNMKTPVGQPAKYAGNITSSGFNFGQFLNEKTIGNVALDVKIDGVGFGLNELKEKVEGTISSIELNGYNYKNITVDGNFEKKLFDGHFAIDDPNLKITKLDGSINFFEKNPGFKLQAKLQKADLRSLGLTKDKFNLLGDFDLNFTGNNIDNFLGTATIKNASLQQANNKLSFDYLNINSEMIAGKKSLSVKTNELDANITGQFNIIEIPNAVRQMLSKYYPTYIKAPNTIAKRTQNFTFSIKTNNAEGYIKLLDKKLGGFDNTTASGSFNLQKNDIALDVVVPDFSYDGKKFKNVLLNSNGTRDTLITDVAVEDVYINEDFHLPNSKINISTNNDVSLIKLNTSASKIFGDAELNASIQTLKNGIKVHFYPSSFVVNDKKWQLDKDGELTLLDKYIDASEVKFYHKDQAILFRTEMDSSGTDDTHLKAELTNIALEDLAFVLPKNPTLKGSATGTITVTDIFRKQLLNFKGSVNNFELDGKNLGKEIIDADVNTNTGKINWKLETNEKDYAAIIEGEYNYKDTLGNSLKINSDIGSFNLDILKPYLTSIFSDVSGVATGKINLKQQNKKLILVGSPTVNNGSLKIGYTQVRYKLDNQVLHFEDGVIDLNGLNVKDTLGNDGQLSGKIYHNFFDDFSFDNVTFSTKKMLLLNTSKKDNNRFYGKIIGNATMKLDGDIANMRMNIEGEPSKNDTSHVYLPTGDTKEANKIDYIDFVPFGNIMESEKSAKTNTNLVVNLDLTANPSCKIDVILDEETGDIIKAEGNGNLKIKAGTNEDLSINGKYELTKGDYVFNFQTFLKKPFTLNKGSIAWNGDPLQAIIDMDAEYLAKNVDIRNLILNPPERAQQEDIKVKSHLTGVLKKPEINFNFELTDKSAYAKDYYTLKKLAEYKNDDNEMTKQVASLLLFNQLLDPKLAFISGNNTANIATSTIGGALSSWLTSVLNKELERATKGFLSFAVDLNPTLNLNQIQANIRSSIQFRFSKSIRLLVGGNLDYNNPLTQLYSKSGFTPDISIEWLLNKEGTIKAIAFNRTTIDATNGQRNRKAIQLGFRKDVNRFGDIFRTKKAIAKREEIAEAKSLANKIAKRKKVLL